MSAPVAGRASLRVLLRGGHDVSTHEGRSLERWRRVLLAALGGGGFRVVSMLGTLVTLPLVHNYSGENSYGLFALVTTLGTLLAFADLGLGNGLISALPSALGRGALDEARRLVSSAILLLTAVAAGLGAIALVVVPTVNWADLLGAGGDAVGQARATVAVFALTFLLALPSSVSQKVHLGLQEGLQANLWLMLGAVLSIAGTVACIAAEASVPWLVGVTLGGTGLASMINCLVLFGRSHPELRPSMALVDSHAVRALASSGVLFLVLSVAGAVAFQTDALVISAMLGTAAVTIYNFPLRLFTLPTLAVSFVLTPLWPAYSDALARGDVAWMKRTLRRSILLASAVNIPISIVLLVLGRPILHAWVGPDFTPPMLLIVAFAVWTASNSLSGPLAMALNGAGVIRVQVVFACLMALSNLGLSIVLTDKLGVAGPVIGSIIAQTVFSTIPSLVVVRRIWGTA